MILEETDVEKIIIDLYLFFTENPNKKLPMQRILLLTKILATQLNGHPAVLEDKMRNICTVNLPDPPLPLHTMGMCTWKKDKTAKQKKK